MSEALRDALSKAYEEWETEETSETPETEEVEAASQEELPSEDTPVETTEETEAPESEETEEPEDSESEEPEKVAKDPKFTLVEDEKPEPPKTPAPQAWKGEAKQYWAELPEEVRAEVDRREREVSTVLFESQQARQLADEFNEVVSPYLGLIEANQSTPLAAVKNFMQTAAGLNLGTPHQKASLVAQIIQTHGVDIQTLDSILSGQASQGGRDDAIMQAIDQRLEPIQRFMGGIREAQQNRAVKSDQELDAEYEAFANDPENIFLEDVRERMAMMFDVAERENRSLTFQEAYDTAVAMDPRLSELAGKRKQAAQAQKESKSLQQKKRAAASIRGSLAGESGNGAVKSPKTLRGQLAAAWDNLAETS